MIIQATCFKEKYNQNPLMQLGDFTAHVAYTGFIIGKISFANYKIQWHITTHYM